MAGESRRKGIFAFGKQSAIGTPLANPTYAQGKVTGGMAPVREKEALPVGGATTARKGNYIQRASAAGTVTLLCHPDALGLLCYEALGAQATVGAATPYTHTFTMSDSVPTPLTVWDLVGDDWWRFADCFVNRLAIRGASGENILVEVGLIAFAARPLSAAPTYTEIAVEPRFKYIGSTTKAEADSATPATLTNVENFELVVDRALEFRYGASLTPAVVAGNERIIDMSMGLVYDTAQQGWDFLVGAYRGATARDADLTQNILKGSFEITTGEHPSSANYQLKFNGNGQNWEYGVERPESDPGGGPVEYDVAGPVVAPTGGGTEITIEVQNSVATNY